MKRLFLTLVMVVSSIGLIFVGTQKTSAAATPAKPTLISTPKSMPKTTGPTPTPRYGGVLKILYSREHTTIGYPPLISATTGIFCGRPAIEPLLDFDSGGHFQPTYLATDWKMASDGKSAIITLRKGVKFHDGTDFNAEAVKWNLDKEIENEMSGTEIWKSIDVIDKDTVRINLTQYDCVLPQNLSLTIGTMVSPTAYAKNGQDWMVTHPVGTGPFKLKSFVQDVSVKYEKFTDYYKKGLPYLDGVELDFMTDPMVQQAALRAGAGQVAYTTIPQYAKDLKELGFNVASQLDTIIWISGDSRNADSPMANQKVREALEYAIDREAIAKLFYGYARAAYQWAIPEFPLGYIPGLSRREYNPAKAKRLLAEAGYPNGFRTRIIFDMNQKLMEPMTAVQSYWKAIGVDCTLEQAPRAQYVQLRSQGWHNGFIEVTTSLFPSNYLALMAQVFSPGYTGTRSIQRPAGWGDTISQTRAALTLEAIKAGMQGLTRKLYEEATVIPLYQWAEPTPMDKSVHDSGIQELSSSSYMWTPEKCWLGK